MLAKELPIPSFQLAVPENPIFYLGAGVSTTKPGETVFGALKELFNFSQPPHWLTSPH